MRCLVLFMLSLLLAGCGSRGGILGEKPPMPERSESAKPQPAQPNETPPKKGGYYLDDGPGDNPPPDLDAIPDAVPRVEPLLARANRPYVALGRSYTPMTEYQPYKASGIASWYGKRYHGQKTSSGEPYDMYGMTAAHTTLPIPSYVRVTNLENKRSVVVRVNDRGPFHQDRLIDLSYAAAYKLRLIEKGSGLVEVEAIDPRRSENAQSAPADVQPALSLEPALAQKAFPSGTLYVQIGAFRHKDNADQLRDRIAQSGLIQNGQVQSWYNDGIHRVRLGPFESREEAERAAMRIKQSLGLNAIVTTQ
ncbi:MAG: septal ring lytic transglycosylase RlpA family protein [Methylophilaceae bacterium]|nr:septal ring lytic transglycosylase RlpA family protein [Methylophilaceae bacterium]